ncbi:hypothetical protein T09_13463 [Trichinella sp. T9]|nr:hypothetical protein T09_13463 [Trichinella sp. T9]
MIKLCRGLTVMVLRMRKPKCVKMEHCNDSVFTSLSSTYRVTFTDCWASLHEGCLRTEKEQQLGTLPTAH